MTPSPLGAPGDDEHEARLLQALLRSASLRPAWFYVGRRPRSTEVFVVTALTVERLEHRRYRTLAAFDWGRGSDWTGQTELAYALLADLTGHRPPDATTFALYREVVGRLPRDGFVVSDLDLEFWLQVGGFDPLRWEPARRREER